ncbi:MAG: hypothetical protein JNL38_19740 [Myxococcales bacterium]|jgi:hypothetical protein|nr:hypothetical protein [Myxococcales bacterium]
MSAPAIRPDLLVNPPAKALGLTRRAHAETARKTLQLIPTGATPLPVSLRSEYERAGDDDALPIIASPSVPAGTTSLESRAYDDHRGAARGPDLPGGTTSLEARGQRMAWYRSSYSLSSRLAALSPTAPSSIESPLAARCDRAREILHAADWSPELDEYLRRELEQARPPAWTDALLACADDLEVPIEARAKWVAPLAACVARLVSRAEPEARQAVFLAIRLLGGFTRGDATPMLAALLDDPRLDVRLAAALALANVFARDPSARRHGERVDALAHKYLDADFLVSAPNIALAAAVAVASIARTPNTGLVAVSLVLGQRRPALHDLVGDHLERLGRHDAELLALGDALRAG